MAEQLDLTTPVTESKITDEFAVVMLMMNSQMELPTTVSIPGTPPVLGVVTIGLKDNNGVTTTHSFGGVLAQDMIKFINTGDFTVKSLHRRILEKLSSTGVLPGAVTGTPELPSAPTGLE